MKYSTIKSIFKNAFQYFFSLVSIHYCNKFLFFISATRLVLTSLQGRLGLFISFIGLSHLGTTIAESMILRGHTKEGEKCHLVEGCSFPRRMVRSECTCVKRKSSEKFRNGNWLPIVEYIF